MLLCALLGIVLTIALATQAALEIHREVIEILHIIGARDTYIATQFQLQALRMGLQGGPPAPAWPRCCCWWSAAPG